MAYACADADAGRTNCEGGLMADTSSKAKAVDAAPPVESKGPPEPEVKEDAPKHEVERLLAESVAFTGYPRHVLVGGLHAANLSHRANLTVDEAKAAVKKFLDHTIPGDDAEVEG